MNAFRGTSSAEFELFMYDFYCEFFWKELNGEVESSNAVTRYGVKRAAEYDIYEGPNVSRYITCMLYLGSYFDENPFLPQFRKILDTDRNETKKIEILTEQTLEFLDESSGTNNEYLLNAFKRLRKPHEEVFPPTKSRSVDDYVLDRLHWFYPEKCRVIGEEILAAAVGLTIEAGKQKNIVEETASAMFAGLTLMVGINFERDPVYSWWLFPKDEAPETDNLNVEAIYRLYRRTLKHLDTINS